MMAERPWASAYSAAELFHLPARYFNDALVSGLEGSGISVFSPQRDGFEFSQFGPILSNHLPSEEVENVLSAIIYMYDLKSVCDSDIVVARFDEPSDPGVDAEVLFANAAKIPVIAYRTDVRSPYGNSTDKFAGMHSFPIKGSQVLIIQPSSNSSENDLHELINKVVHEATTVLNTTPIRDKRIVPEAYQPIFSVIDLLFTEINVHTEKGLIELIDRYQKNKERTSAIEPRVIR